MQHACDMQQLLRMANTLRPVQPSLRYLSRRSAAALPSNAVRARSHASYAQPGSISGRSSCYTASRCVVKSNDLSAAGPDVQRVIKCARKAATQDFTPNSVVQLNHSSGSISTILLLAGKRCAHL